MIYPVVPKDKDVVIATRKGRVIVSRFQQTGNFTFELEEATNWMALEPEAIQAVEAQIGAITEDDVFPCPPELAAKARW